MTFAKRYEPACLGVDKLCCVEQPMQGQLHPHQTCLLFLWPLLLLARNLVAFWGTKISANLGFSEAGAVPKKPRPVMI